MRRLRRFIAALTLAGAALAAASAGAQSWAAVVNDDGSVTAEGQTWTAAQIDALVALYLTDPANLPPLPDGVLYVVTQRALERTPPAAEGGE